MSPPSSPDRKPALTVAARGWAMVLDQLRALIEQDVFYATDAGYAYLDDLEDAHQRLQLAAREAIERQLTERAG